MTRFERHAPAGSELPVLITPSRAGESLIDAFPRLHRDIEAHLSTVGGVLLRGFDVPSVDDFRQFAAAFGHPLLSYEFGSTPRTAVSSGIYTSTEYPAHQHIPLHNEQAYTREWPMKIWFHCVVAAQSGGETPIADSRAIYRRIPQRIRSRFEEGLLYVRNYGDFDVPWQQVFNTDSPETVEAFCRRAGIEWEWKGGSGAPGDAVCDWKGRFGAPEATVCDWKGGSGAPGDAVCHWEGDGKLRTRQRCQGVERHPKTGEKVWFNQAHLFHVSNLPAEARESLEDLFGIENLPRNVYFADGSPIEDAMLDEVRAVLAEETVTFPWQVGDVMMLDNMLAAHARTPFKGPRKVVVAMAEPHGNLGKL